MKHNMRTTLFNHFGFVFKQLKQTVDTVKKDEKDAFKRNENQTSKNRPGADVPGTI
jgi:hypothetical protein